MMANHAGLARPIMLLLVAVTLCLCLCCSSAVAAGPATAYGQGTAFQIQPMITTTAATRQAAGTRTACSASPGRREALRLASAAALGVLLAPPSSSEALEWIPDAPKEGDCADCIGVKDGFLAGCPNTPTCVSSQDDQGPKADWANAYAEPWVYDGKVPTAMLKLKMQVQRMGGKVTREDERYLRVEFREQGLPGQVDNFDDTEFYFTPNDSTVQFRSARRRNKSSGSMFGDFGANKNRMEKMRIALRWEKVPVLRNRKRALVFFESPFDTFGPSCNGVSCGEDLEGAAEELRGAGVRFDSDPLAAPAMPVKTK